MKRILFGFILIVISSCPALASVPVTGVTLYTQNMTLALGMDDNWLFPTITPSDATNKRVTWSSSNEAVVSVEPSAFGKVHAIALGTAIVTVTTEEGGFKASCTVVVVDTGKRNANAQYFTDKSEAAAKTIGFSEGDFESVDGGVAISKSIIDPIAMKLSSDIIEASSLPCFKAELESGKAAAVRRISVRASLLKVAQPSSHLEDILILSIISPDAGELLKYAPSLDDLDDGMFTVIPIVGIPENEQLFELVLCIKDGGRFDLDKTENGLVVAQIAILGKSGSGEYVALNKNTTSILTGGTEKLIATAFPATIKLTWSSSNTSVATVDASGLVTGVSDGTTIITVTTEGGYTANCLVSVHTILPPPQPQPVTVLVGGTVQLVVPGVSTDIPFTWSSSNTDIATVSASGLVTGVSAGAVIITAIEDDVGYAASWAVTIAAVPDMNGVSLAPSSTSIKVKSKQQLWATILPLTVINNTGVLWSSSNTAIVTVSDSGLITGVLAGKATITAKTKDEVHYATCEVTVFNESDGGGNGNDSGGGCSAQNYGLFSFALMFALTLLKKMRMH